MLTRHQLHQLIDAIPDDRLPALEAAIEPLTDPVARAVMLAPEDDEPLTAEDIEALREAKDDIARGNVVSHKDIKREFGLS